MQEASVFKAAPIEEIKGIFLLTNISINPHLGFSESIASITKSVFSSKRAGKVSLFTNSSFITTWQSGFISFTLLAATSAFDCPRVDSKAKI